MGCAGSRPSQLIPSLGSHHHHHHHHHMNSPQKGFILFNAKTIDYLQANELEIKEKLKARCEQKLTKAIPQSTSSKSLLNNAKRTLLFNSNNTTVTSGDDAAHNTDENTSNNISVNGVKQTKSDASLALNGTLNTDLKSPAIEAAVDYVLKYALNDFDIENFKSSNHLSMKQIRKDIMKKNNSVSSLSKMNNSISMNTNNNMSGTLSNKSATLSSKSYDASSYKQALNTAIDEFGLFVQENFIIINEFDKNAETELAAQPDEEKEPEKLGKTEEDSDVEALKLKEALEVARHNFYKGKISMVCLTKAGGYVVKEVKDQGPHEPEGAVLLPNANQTTKAEASPVPAEKTKSVTPRVIPEINIEDAATTEKKLEEKKVSELASVDELMRKVFVNKEYLQINEFISIKTELIAKLNKTIASIVSFTKESSGESGVLLRGNLDESKHIIELLLALNESELERVDEKMVEAILNLDHVNKEFKTYMNALEENSNSGKKTSDENNAQIKELSVQIDEMNTALPRVLFTSKCLPHPAEAQSKNEAIEINNKVEVEEKAIDIKKEIAFSILNVGEVLAKTIDYYSHDQDTPEIKDLIEISQRNSHMDIASKLSKSPSSSLVSPSTSSSASVGSIHQQDATASSPVQNSKTNNLSNSKDNLCSNGPSTPVPPPELNLESTSAVTCDTNSTPQQQEFSTENKKDNKEIIENEILSDDDFQPIEDKASLIQPETKSSSSSSDVLSNNDEIEDSTAQTALKNQVTGGESILNPVVFRNGEILTTQSTNKTQMTQQRMSLDEELFYNLAEVDKKVKYMNETCSEDDGEDDDDDLDDENFDYDESVELENANDERLFHPKTPAKIKSEVRNNRTVDLQEEIKQISNVIQDLVQTINVRNSTNTSGTDVQTNSGDNKSSLENSDNNNVDSEDGSQNSGSGGDYKTKSYHYNRNSNGSHTSSNISDRKNINARRSVGNQSLNSSIPISVSRQKIMKKGASIENESELINATNNSFVDFNETPETPERSSLNNSNINKSASSQRFRSKLPVKK